MAMMYVGNRGIIDRLTESISRTGPVRQPDIIDAPARPVAQLSAAPDWRVLDGNIAVRQEQIESTAIRVYTRLYPHTPPTRENIQRNFPQLKSNGYISAVMALLKERGVADGGGQGSPYTWVVRDE
jgi:hypothetical protein